MLETEGIFGVKGVYVQPLGPQTFVLAISHLERTKKLAQDLWVKTL